MRSTIILIFSCAALALFSQNETANWQLCLSGMDFMQSPPAPTYTSMHAPKGNSTISDANGSLLFYTNGDTVYNSMHQVMANGVGIGGNVKAVQSALIMKKPGNNSLYYIFCQNGWLGLNKPKGLYYSVVDMSLAAGQGSVVVKNALIDSTAMLEKLAGTDHCNGTDAWVLVHDHPGTTFKAFLLTANGISLTPVLSSLGPQAVFCTLGTMRFSSNGKKLGFTGNNGYSVFDFDNSTGVVSNFIGLGPGYDYTSGCEFSPDGTKFYGGYHPLNGNGQLYQWDLCAGTPSDILNSRYTYTHSAAKGFREMQLAMDGKIYVGGVYFNWGNSFAIVKNPNAAGAACNVVLDSTLYSFVVASRGLGNFNSSFFNPPNSIPQFSIQANMNCTSVGFDLLQISPAFGCKGSGNRAQTIQWDFGDPLSGASNTSTLLTPQHLFSDTGHYQVMAIVWHDCRMDTLRTQLHIKNHLPPLSLSGPATICKGETATLAAAGAHTDSWSNGSTTSSLVLSPSVGVVHYVIGTNTLTSCYAKVQHTVAVAKCVSGGEEFHKPLARVFPNPAAGILYVEMELPAGEMIIRDPLARVVLVSSVSANTVVDISHLSEGLYYYQLRNGDVTYQGKFVKQKE